MSIIVASALGGLGDAASVIWLCLVGFGLLVVGAFLGYSWWMYSSVAARVACVFICGVAVILQPWVFISPRESPFGESDGFDWLLIGRLAVAAWTLVIFFAVACLARASRHQKSGKDADHAA